MDRPRSFAEELAALVLKAGPQWPDAVRIDQKNRWIEGRGILAENYRDALPILRENEEAWLELVRGEFMDRVDREENLDVEEYLRRFPEHAAALRPELEVYPGLLPSYVKGLGSDTDDPSTLSEPLGVSDFLPPARLGGFKICEPLGQGATGLVCRAYDPRFDRYVALKLMRPSLLERHPSAPEWFLREARSMGCVRSDYVVTVYQSGMVCGLPFLVMEELRGESLKDRLARRGRLGGEESARIGLETALGLAALHRCGIIHRDIKPSNIWLEDRSREAPQGHPERVKILDFGLARPVQLDGHITSHFVGTPVYSSPEHANGTTEPRSDLFSLGCVLYQMLTGQLPFRGKTITAVLKQVQERNPTPAADVVPGVPIELSRLIEHLLAKDPNQRPGSAEEVVRVLSGLVAQEARPIPLPGEVQTDPQFEAFWKVWQTLSPLQRRAWMDLMLAGTGQGRPVQLAEGEHAEELAASA
jgi:serine/threonine protein kinase